MRDQFNGTPGPWRLNEHGDIVDEQGESIADIWVPVAGDVDANARLIAAAPELLEALQRMVEAWESALVKSVPALNQQPEYLQAKRVINKALEG